MKKKFIVNPAARGGSVGWNLSEIRDFFKTRSGDFDVAITKTYTDIEESARQAFRDGYEQVVAIGGDGTVGAVFNGYFESGEPVNPNACIAVSNWGTGSDYFKILQSHRPSDWKELVFDHTLRSVDVGVVEFQESFLPPRIFANMASIGLSAEVAQRKNTGFSIPFGLSYVLPTIKTLASFKAPMFRVESEEGTKSEKAFAVIVSKGVYLGGGMKVGNDVELDDGSFEVTLVRSMTLGQALSRLPKLYTGGIRSDEYFKKARVKEITIGCDPKAAVELDGEAFPPSDVKITLKPKAVKVCFPKS